ncbi:hypothetical protein BpHYR1_026206 [Brachionus plicatilis]|uniref:Uncharacterized protein n=1 Tax=Brachionus plicatilis TaxID=10195 RepID=A0A3M7R061_BRAPC|nr:hypothetical protein BpHYR1_026206 [Brachionus plicatilis]
MSSKLCILSYTAIWFLNVLILLMLGTIMLMFYAQVAIIKEFPDSCFTTSSNLNTTTTSPEATSTITQLTSDTTIIQNFQSIVDQTELAVTILAATVEPGGFGGPCNATSDCDYSTYSLSDGTIINSITCDDGICSCLAPYSVYFYESSTGNYFCKLEKDGPCTETIQCAAGTCNPGKNVCTSDAG